MAWLLALLHAVPAVSAATALTTCSAGWFWHVEKQQCEDCPAGKFQALPGALECEACAPGRFQHLEGQLECIHNPCAAGTVPSMDPGNACTACPPGRAAAAGASACRKCEMLHGEYSYGAGRAACLNSTCPSGHFQAATGCIPCPANHFQPWIGQPHCFACRQGQTSPEGSATCTGGTAWSPPAIGRCEFTTCQYNGHHVRVEHRDPPPPVENPLSAVEVFFRQHDAAYTHAIFRTTMAGPLGDAWRALPEGGAQRAQYAALAVEDRARYEAEIAQYRKNHHCFWRTLTLQQSQARCCAHEGLTAEQCFHRTQPGHDGKQGHCDHNGRAPLNHEHGECICLCYKDAEIGW